MADQLFADRPASSATMSRKGRSLAERIEPAATVAGRRDHIRAGVPHAGRLSDSMFRRSFLLGHDDSEQPFGADDS